MKGFQMKSTLYFNKKLNHNHYKEEYFNTPILSMRILCFFIILFFALTPVLSSTEILTSEELKEISNKIEFFERRLSNIRIKSEVWVETKTNLSDACEPWLRTPIYVESISWFDLESPGRVRIDVNQEIIKCRVKELNTYSENNYSLTYDGKIGKVIQNKSGILGESISVKKGEISNVNPELLTSGNMRICTGQRFSLYFSNENYGINFSQLLAGADDPNTKVSSSFDFTLEEFDMVKCMKIATKLNNKSQQIYWLDPARGYSLLGDKRTIKDGSEERLIGLIKIEKIKEISEGIWWPTEAYVISPPIKSGEPFAKTVYRAIDIVANDPNFNKDIFNPTFPDGYFIYDKTTGKKYISGQK